MKKLLYLFFILTFLICCKNSSRYEGYWECIQGSSERFIEIKHTTGDNYVFTDNDDSYPALIKNGVLTVKNQEEIFSFPINKDINELICDYGCSCQKFVRQ